MHRLEATLTNVSFLQGEIMYVPSKLLNFVSPVNSEAAVVLDVIRDLPFILTIPNYFPGSTSSLLNCDCDTIGYNLHS